MPHLTTSSLSNASREKGTPCWACDKCGKFFQTKGIYLAHERKLHGVNTENANL